MRIGKPKATCAAKKVQNLCQDTEDNDGQPAKNQKGYFYFDRTRSWLVPDKEYHGDGKQYDVGPFLFLPSGWRG